VVSFGDSGSWTECCVSTTMRRFGADDVDVGDFGSSLRLGSTYMRRFDDVTRDVDVDVTVAVVSESQCPLTVTVSSVSLSFFDFSTLSLWLFRLLVLSLAEALTVLGLGFFLDFANDDFDVDDVDELDDDDDDDLSLLLFFFLDLLPLFLTSREGTLSPLRDLATVAISLSTLASSHRTWIRDLTPSSSTLEL